MVCSVFRAEGFLEQVGGDRELLCGHTGIITHMGETGAGRFSLPSHGSHFLRARSCAEPVTHLPHGSAAGDGREATSTMLYSPHRCCVPSFLTPCRISKKDCRHSALLLETDTDLQQGWY